MRERDCYPSDDAHTRYGRPWMSGPMPPWAPPAGRPQSTRRSLRPDRWHWSGRAGAGPLLAGLAFVQIPGVYAKQHLEAVQSALRDLSGRRAGPDRCQSVCAGPLSARLSLAAKALGDLTAPSCRSGPGRRRASCIAMRAAGLPSCGQLRATLAWARPCGGWYAPCVGWRAGKVPKPILRASEASAARGHGR